MHPGCGTPYLRVSSCLHASASHRRATNAYTVPPHGMFDPFPQRIAVESRQGEEISPGGAESTARKRAREAATKQRHRKGGTVASSMCGHALPTVDGTHARTHTNHHNRHGRVVAGSEWMERFKASRILERRSASFSQHPDGRRRRPCRPDRLSGCQWLPPMPSWDRC